MNRASVLVTGSGNTTGMNVIRALVGHVEKLVGYDCCPTNQNPSNLYCVNEQVPRADEPGYIDAVSALAQKHGARYIIASNDHEVRALAMCAEKFKRCGVTINAMTSNVLSYLDKLETSNLFSAAGVPTPKVLTAVNPPLPYVVRKRLVGSGRKYTHIVRTVDEENVLSFFPDASIITECLSGDEYTVDVLAHQGFMVAAVPRLRREVRNGMVHFGEVVKDYKVLNWTQHMVGQLKFDGIYCVQCIKNKDGCFFFEVNPRPGSGIDLSTAAGVNMPLLWLMSQEGNKFSAPEPVWGTKMVRYSSGYYFR